MKRAGVLLAVMLTVQSVAWAGDVRWPSGRAAAAAQADPISEVRWVNAETGWTSTNATRLAHARTLLEQRSAGQADAPRWAAMRAVLLRLEGHFDEARTTLDAAVAADATVLNDVDVALTQAFLLAQAHRYAEAVVAGRRVLPRMGIERTVRGVDAARNEVVLELARWSMARGPDGLADAVAVLYEGAAMAPLSPLVRATLALALARSGAMDQAREVARGGDLPPSYNVAIFATRGSQFGVEVDAAIGTAYVLVERGREVPQLLEEAVRHTAPEWKAFLTEIAAQARRQAAAQPGVPRVNGR